MKGGYSQLTIEAHIVRKRGFMSFTWLLVGSSGLENLNAKLHNNNCNRGCSDSMLAKANVSCAIILLDSYNESNMIVSYLSQGDILSTCEHCMFCICIHYKKKKSLLTHLGYCLVW